MIRAKACTFMAASLTALLVVGISQSYAAKEKVPDFIEREHIEEPYTNDKCLKNCHGEEGTMAGTALGRTVDLHIDLKRYVLSVHGKKGIECIDCHQNANPNVHPREGYPNADCRACHSSRKTEGLFPVDALKKLKEKGIKPPPNEARTGEVWMNTSHAWEWEHGNPDAPFCSDCHTAHYVLKAEDPASSVNPDNIAKTCGRCHVEQVSSSGIGGVLAGWRISGHGKGDASTQYASERCLACHQGQGAHAEENVTGDNCPDCHRPELKVDQERSDKFHLKGGFEDGPSTVTATLYTFLIWGGGAALGLLALFIGFTTLYRREDADG